MIHQTVFLIYILVVILLENAPKVEIQCVINAYSEKSKGLFGLSQIGAVLYSISYLVSSIFNIVSTYTTIHLVLPVMYQ